MTSNISISPLSTTMSFDPSCTSKGDMELPTELTLPLACNGNDRTSLPRRRAFSVVSSGSSSVSSSKRSLSRHSLPFKKRKFLLIAIETDDDQKQEKKHRENADLLCLSHAVGAFSPDNMTTANTGSCTNATSTDDSTRSLCSSNAAVEDPQPKKEWSTTTPGLGIVLPVVSSSPQLSQQCPQQGSAVACITPVPATPQKVVLAAPSQVSQPTENSDEKECNERNITNKPTSLKSSQEVVPTQRRSGDNPVPSVPPTIESSRPKRAPRDRLYRGCGSSQTSEVRCLAISTRGKRCCYAAVDLNGNRYCHRHSSFYDTETNEDNEPPNDQAPKLDRKKTQDDTATTRVDAQAVVAVEVNEGVLLC